VNIQIFGKSKCFDTKKAERFFKERRIKYQLVDIVKFGLSKGEYQSVKSAVGGSGRSPNGELLDHTACIDALIDVKSKEYETQYIAHISDKNDIEERLLENPGMFKTPIVRNGKKATVGYQPDIWTAWEKGE